MATSPDAGSTVQSITDARALSAMAHPVRSRMLDALAVDGPSTASALAKRTDQAVGSASHHLKMLHQAGLVEPAPELAADRRERWWRLVATSQRWARSDFADDAGAVTAALAAESLALRKQFERSQDWLAQSDSADPFDKAAFVTQTWLRLTPAELAELSTELIELIQRWRQRTGPGQLAADHSRDEAADAERRSVLVFARGFPTEP